MSLLLDWNLIGVQARPSQRPTMAFDIWSARTHGRVRLVLGGVIVSGETQPSLLSSARARESTAPRSPYSSIGSLAASPTTSGADLPFIAASSSSAWLRWQLNISPSLRG